MCNVTLKRQWSLTGRLKLLLKSSQISRLIIGMIPHVIREILRFTFTVITGTSTSCVMWPSFPSSTLYYMYKKNFFLLLCLGFSQDFNKVVDYFLKKSLISCQVHPKKLFRTLFCCSSPSLGNCQLEFRVCHLHVI